MTNGTITGQFGRQENSGSDLLQRSELSVGNTINPDLEAKFAIDINGMIDKEGTFHLAFTYNKKEYKKSTVATLAGLYRSALSDLIRHCTQKQEKELTPSDLTYSDLSIAELETLENKIKNLVNLEN